MELHERNIHDYLKSLSNEDVKEYCQTNASPTAVLACHVNGDFNVSQIIRNANFFGFGEVFYWGRKKIDPRGAVGTKNYTPLTHLPDHDSMMALLDDERFTTVALENNVDYNMWNADWFDWPKNTLLIVGEESLGLSDEILSKCKYIVTIPGHGSVRSINVSTASGLAMGYYNRSQLR